MRRGTVLKNRGELRRALTLVLAIPLLVGLVACAGRGEAGDFGDERVRIDLRVAPSPPTIGPARVALTLTDPAGLPIDGATVEVEGAMTHAGMQSVVARAAGRGAGAYATDTFRFTMGGDWLLIVRVTLPDGGRAQRTFPFNGVGG